MVDIIKTTIARDEYAGDIKGVFERANKAWPWVSHNNPERLCKICVNSMLEVSMAGDSTANKYDPKLCIAGVDL